MSEDQVLLLGETPARGVGQHLQTLTRFIMRCQASDLLLTLPITSLSLSAAVKLTEADARLPEFPFPLRTQDFDTGNMTVGFLGGHRLTVFISRKWADAQSV